MSDKNRVMVWPPDDNDELFRVAVKHDNGRSVLAFREWSAAREYALNMARELGVRADYATQDGETRDLAATPAGDDAGETGGTTE